MKQKTSGMIAFLGMLALAGCYSYQSEAINNASYNEVQANPFFAKINVGDSDQVLVRLVNAANNGALTSYTLGAVPAGIQVHFNPNYRPVWNAATDSLVPTGDKTAQQYYVLGVTPGKYSFTLTPTSVNTSVSTTVTVVVSPINLGAALGTTSGLHAGDTVTISLPAGVVFNRTAGTTVSVPTFTTGPAPAVSSFSADSTTMKILVAPGDSGKLTVTNIGELNATAAPKLTLSSTNAISLVPPVLVAPTTLSATTALIGVPITVALGNNLRFINSSQVLIGGTLAGISGLSADSSTATVIPMATSSGAVTFQNLALSFLPTVPLSLPSDGKTFTVGSTFGGPTSAGANSPTTADTIKLVGSRSTVVADGGAFTTNCLAGSPIGTSSKCRYYVVTTQAAAVSGDLVWGSATNIDLGLYVLNAAGTNCVADIADDNGAEPGLTGEHDTAAFKCDFTATTNLTVGTFIIAVVDFSAAAPTWVEFRISQP